MNCFSMFNHLVGLAHKGLSKKKLSKKLLYMTILYGNLLVAWRHSCLAILWVVFLALFIE